MTFANINIMGRLMAGFGAVVVLTGGLGWVALDKIDVLAGFTSNLYQHPYTVTTEFLEAEVDIIALHRSMKDVALSQNPEQLAAAIKAANDREVQVYQHLDLAAERFLGDKAKVAELRKTFADWRPIREQVFLAMHEDRRADAGAITKTQGAAQVKMVSDQIDELVKFSRNKAAAFADRAESEHQSVRVQTLSLLGIIVALSVALATLITRSITKPLGSLRNCMGLLAEGRLDEEVPHHTRGDEVGDMARTVLVFRDNARRVHALEMEQEASKIRDAAARRQSMIDLANEFEKHVEAVVDHVASAADRMNTTATSMSAAAEQASNQAKAAAAAAEEASGNVQTVASAAEELAASIAEIGRQVDSSTTTTRHAVEKARHTNTIVRSLADAANRIGEVVGLINDIASQTNLLALNATIEAARAGDAGKGFAVVANEVKSLANQTGKATEDIGQQISGVQTATRDAVAAIEDILGTIGNLSEVTSSIASAVEEQQAATAEIARNVEQAAQGTATVARNITGVSAAARQAGDTSEEVLSESADLSQQSVSLRQQVEGFINNLRAG
ncbi:MAG: methyl-accepting chemotaxis protein [Rhodospirillaceae bacterium]|nr:methyl-accepting chemotaxis protein [Rhodospirillales bacterium]